MKDPTRTKAIRRLNSDPEIRKILAENPRVAAIVEEARTYKPVHGYSRISLYYHHKQRILNLLREPEAGDIYMLISDLLPMDACDKENDEPCISGRF